MSLDKGPLYIGVNFVLMLVAFFTRETLGSIVGMRTKHDCHQKFLFPVIGLAVISQTLATSVLLPVYPTVITSTFFTLLQGFAGMPNDD